MPALVEFVGWGGMEWRSKVPHTLLVPSSGLLVIAEGPAKGKSLRDALAAGLSVNRAHADNVGGFGIVMPYQYNGAVVAVKELLVNPLDNGALGASSVNPISWHCLELLGHRRSTGPIIFAALVLNRRWL